MRGVFLDQSTMNPEDLSFESLEQALEEVVYYPVSSVAQVVERAAGFEVIVTNKALVTREHLAALPALKLICITATGTNNVDLEAAKEHGVTVCNVTDYAGPSVAQHTIALMLGLATQWHRYNQAVYAGEWAKSPMFCMLDYPVMELAGKTLGIIGYGDLGRQVARAAEALGMKVLIGASLADRNNPAPGRVAFDELVRQVDVLSLHCPLTDLSRNLIDQKVFAAMKPSAFLVNTARGGIVNEEDLLQALQQGEIRGAALDVLSVEPPPADHPLIQARLPNLILTPHAAWISREARQRLLDGTAANIRQFRQGEPINVVAGV